LAIGMNFERGFETLFITGGALAIATILAKPIINILLLPINLVTFNFFRWASHAVMLFLVDLVLTEFRIVNFNFAGYSSDLFSLPLLYIESGILSYLAFSVLIGLVAGVFYWIMEK